MIQNTKKLLCATLLTGTMFLSGCTQLGDQFTKLESPKNGESIVYFYRPSSFLGGGISYNIKEGDAVITEMCNGGYNYYSTKPGQKTYWAKTEAKDELSLNIEKGKTYFVKAGLTPGFFVGHPNLSIVSKETALSEIKECKKVLMEGK